MSDSSSGRDPQTNSGSDSAKHHGKTAHEAYKSAPDSPLSTPITGTLSNGFVGNVKTTK